MDASLDGESGKEIFSKWLHLARPYLAACERPLTPGIPSAFVSQCGFSNLPGGVRSRRILISATYLSHLFPLRSPLHLEFKVFYSWQNDRPTNRNRYFIRDATEVAIKRLASDLVFEHSPRLDHDTLDVSGSPEIVGTIINKIRTSAVFLADLTFVGSSGGEEGVDKPRLLPNPNVLLELGYAAATLGWGRIINVMNTFYGDAEQLPFDLKHRRWPIRYNLGPDQGGLTEQRITLAGSISQALSLAANEDYESAKAAVGALDVDSAFIVRSLGTSRSFWPAPRFLCQGV
jgi:hypothetical protein